MLNALRNLLRAPEQKASRTGAADRAAVRRPGALDAARLRGARARRLCAERDRLSRREAGRRERRRLARSWWRRAARRATRHPLLDLLARPNPREDGAQFLETRRDASPARRQRLCRGGERRGRPARAARAAPRPHEAGARRGRLARGLRIHGRGPQRALRSGRAAAAADPASARCCIRSTIITGSRRSKPRRSRSTRTMRRRRWNKALLDNAARPSGALVYAGADGAVLSDDQFERLKRELEDELSGRAQRRPAAAAGRRARLEVDVALAQGHGLHGGEARRGARDRARLRRAAAAARHSGRQHLFELPGSQPRVLPRDRAAVREPHRAARSRTGSRPRSAVRASSSMPTRSMRSRSDRAALWSRVTDAPFLTLNEKRAAVGYAPLEGGDRLE